MADIDLYVDPVCPFAWVAAGWLLATAGDEHSVTLRQMSLAVLNEGHAVDAAHDRMISRSRRVGRVFAAAVRTAGSAAFTDLYLALGARLHPRRPDVDDDAAVSAALAAAGLDAALASALDDTEYDYDVEAAHKESQAVLGTRGGSPIMAVDGVGWSGPVLVASPPPRRSRQLLDALLTAARTPEFAALHRPYVGPPAFTAQEETN